MSDKALLVMGMPENCGKCLLRSLADDCGVTGRNVMDYRHLKNKPDWCPLKPIPEKRKADVLPLSPLLKETLSEYSKGWNACIDKILEEESRPD